MRQGERAIQEGRNVGLSGSFGGITLGRNWQTSGTTGLSFYRVSEDLLNVTITVMQDKAKDWEAGAMFLANQKGGSTTKGFGVTLQFDISTQAGREALDLYLKTRFPPQRRPSLSASWDFTSEGGYDRYQMPALGIAAWGDENVAKGNQGEEGVTKEFGGEQVHKQDPTWLAELTGDRELYSSAQLISQQVRGKEQYTAIINIKSESGEYNREQFGKIFMGVKSSGPVKPSGTWTLSAEIDKKVVHELERVSTKFKDAKDRDDKQRILSDVFRKAGAAHGRRPGAIWRQVHAVLGPRAQGRSELPRAGGPRQACRTARATRREAEDVARSGCPGGARGSGSPESARRAT